MAMPIVKSAVCPECGHLWETDELELFAYAGNITVRALALTIGARGCRAVGQTCDTTAPADWTRDDIRNIGTILFGVDAFVSGPMPDEESAFGLFD